ncbi:type II toxin-antitoxin system RelE/ParE family toxin [Rhizobium sp. SG741]|uniref:type II toxin-antitoxin system RelE/ParE family toxin n=1 Tax=Rhizobium sp. SG741 TaxID=2587114 RepID=UPI0032B22E5C
MVENWSAKQAEAYHAEIVEAFEGLASGLKIGRRIHIREGHFKHAIGSYVIYYLLPDAEVAIIRVLHWRMDVSRLLLKRDWSFDCWPHKILTSARRGSHDQPPSGPIR